ncbi:MAG: magnesium transporter [Saprospiraceae bacterium]|nr:magnesium transporter [Saprospiraceae bacterium]
MSQDLSSKHPYDIANSISALNPQEQTMAFLLLPGDLEGEVFPYFEQNVQKHILKSLGSKEIAKVISQMQPDDRTILFETFPDSLIKEAVNLLSDEERKMALSLIGYKEDSVGRMMTPMYVQAKRESTVRQTLDHIKKYGKRAETLNYIYVVDEDQLLIDDIQIGKLLMADDSDTIESLMDHTFISLKSTQLVEDAISLFEKYDRQALPVVSENGVLVGIVTVDDIIDQIEKRDTEDIQKFGGSEGLDLSYTKTGLIELVKKRAGWLIVLFLGEMLTASAMGYFDEEISKAVVLALFVPLIISSGGNSGSQAASLIIRAMALKELQLKDWWYVMRKEIFSGLLLGTLLGIIGFARILIWQETGIFDYGPFWFWVALSVSISLVFIVLWGTLSGSLIPFLLRWLGLDPATASAPFVATLVDVTGLVIYFSISAVFLTGKLL